MTRDVSVFVKCDTIFRLFFGDCYNFILLTFARECGNTLKLRWGVLPGFCWKFTWLSSSERILKIR